MLKHMYERHKAYCKASLGKYGGIKSMRPRATSHCVIRNFHVIGEPSGLAKLYAIREGLKAVQMKGIYPGSLQVDLLPFGIGNTHRWTPNFSSKYLETISKCFSPN